VFLLRKPSNRPRIGHKSPFSPVLSLTLLKLLMWLTTGVKSHESLPLINTSSSKPTFFGEFTAAKVLEKS
jgi:hypothetical protein